jgi:hypothetical protein
MGHNGHFFALTQCRLTPWWPGDWASSRSHPRQPSSHFERVESDSVYGNSPKFVHGVRQLGKWYVLDVSSEAHVWTKQPQVIPPE